MSEDQNLPEDEEAVEGADLSWVPEKFRNNPEKFAEAYTNLEREYHSSRQEVKGLEDAISNLSSQFEEFTAQNRPDQGTVLSQWQEQYEVDPFSTTLSLIQAVTAQQAQAQQSQQPRQVATPDVVAFIADQTMGQNYEDWGNYKEKVGELIAQNPLFQRDELWESPQSAAQAFDSAYQMVKAQDVLSGNSVIQQQVADTRAMKLNAQSAAGASGRTPAPDDHEKRWQEIMEAPSNKLGL